MSGTSRRAPARRVASGVQIGELAARGMVLQGASVAFAERGLRDTSVEDILRGSGVSRRTFYRLYKSKEDVAAALYRFGTDALLEACRTSIAAESDPLRRMDRCIDVHLDNARELGRLIHVLGAEAQAPGSLLHARRMEVHDAIVAMLVAAWPSSRGAIDPMVFRGLVLALEGLTRIALEEGDEGRRVTPAALDRVRGVMQRMAHATLAAD